MKTYRVAMLGCRSRGTSAARAYHAHPRIEVVGLCDLIQERLDTLGDELGVSAQFSDLDEMIQQTQPDLVAIPTGTEFHYPLAMRVLRAWRQHRGRKTDVYGPRRGGRGARQGQGAGRAGRRPPSGARGRLHARDGAGLRSRAHRQAALYLRQRQGLLWRLRPDEHWRPLAQLRHQVRRALPQPDRHGPHRRPPHHPAGRNTLGERHGHHRRREHHRHAPARRQRDEQSAPAPVPDCGLHRLRHPALRHRGPADVAQPLDLVAPDAALPPRRGARQLAGAGGRGPRPLRPQRPGQPGRLLVCRGMGARAG